VARGDRRGRAARAGLDPTDPMPMWDRGATVDALPAEAVEKLLAVAGPDAEAVRP
jgi:hypothetical protein